MSKYDAEEALSIYRNFCAQTERVVEYLGVAKKLQNLLNVPIPNLKHVGGVARVVEMMLIQSQAPVSLASSLQEYLNDPNFEQNRLEYKASKAAGDRNSKDRNGGPSTQPHKGTVAADLNSIFIQCTPVAPTNATTTETSVGPPSPPPTGANSKPSANHTAADFFSSIEEKQTPIFNPVTGR